MMDYRESTQPIYGPGRGEDLKAMMEDNTDNIWKSRVSQSRKFVSETMGYVKSGKCLVQRLCDRTKIQRIINTPNTDNTTCTSL